MLELDSRGLPFRSPNKVLYETRYRLVASVEPNSVIKVSKEGSDRSIFPTVGGALSEINENEASRAKIASLLNSIGANSEMVVHIPYVHNVLVDPRGMPLLVDVESLNKFAKYTRYGIKGWIRKKIKEFGFSLSICILDGLLFMRESGLRR